MKSLLRLSAVVIPAILAFAILPDKTGRHNAADETVMNPASVRLGAPRLVHTDGFRPELFESAFPPEGWELVNPDASITFGQYVGANGPSFGGSRSVRIDFYDYGTTGQRDTLFTPVFEGLENTDSLKFDYAYAQYSSSYRDSLIVLLSTDGGDTWPYVLFRKGGASLATAPMTGDPFVPSGPSQWGRFAYTLNGVTNAVFAFVTYNAYGNNLYLDNVAVGTQSLLDVAPIGITNIPADTSYATNGSNVTVAPVVLVANLGMQNTASSFDVTITGSPGGYTSTRSVASLNAGSSTELTFDNVLITLATPTVFVVSTALADSNRSNDTITHSSVILAGTERRVLFEEWTSSTCPPCASQNPTIDAFVEAYWDDVVAVKYHVGWPSPGNDPMYLYNPTQSYDRRYYYNVNAAPTLILDGVSFPEYEYSVWDHLLDPYTDRAGIGCPIEMTVTSTRSAPDSIHAEVHASVLSPLTEGIYYLRVQAIEHIVRTREPNGEPHAL